MYRSTSIGNEISSRNARILLVMYHIWEDFTIGFDSL